MWFDTILEYPPFYDEVIALREDGECFSTCFVLVEEDAELKPDWQFRYYCDNPEIKVTHWCYPPGPVKNKLGEYKKYGGYCTDRSKFGLKITRTQLITNDEWINLLNNQIKE